MKYLITLGLFLLVLTYSPPVEACNCRVTFIAKLNLYDLSVRDPHSTPFHCSTGFFSYDRQKRIVQLQWIQDHWISVVHIFLPVMPVIGTLSIEYCWGDDQAIIGLDRIPVTLTYIRIFRI